MARAYRNVIRFRPTSETFENAVASVVDFGSILLAYEIGSNRFSIETGLLYGIFDAFIVVWMRKPIYKSIRMLVGRNKK